MHEDQILIQILKRSSMELDFDLIDVMDIEFYSDQNNPKVDPIPDWIKYK